MHIHPKEKNVHVLQLGYLVTTIRHSKRLHYLLEIFLN